MRRARRNPQRAADALIVGSSRTPCSETGEDRAPCPATPHRRRRNADSDAPLPRPVRSPPARPRPPAGPTAPLQPPCAAPPSTRQHAKTNPESARDPSLCSRRRTGNHSVTIPADHELSLLIYHPPIPKHRARIRRTQIDSRRPGSSAIPTGVPIRFGMEIGLQAGSARGSASSKSAAGCGVEASPARRRPSPEREAFPICPRYMWIDLRFARRCVAADVRAMLRRTAIPLPLRRAAAT